MLIRTTLTSWMNAGGLRGVVTTGSKLKPALLSRVGRDTTLLGTIVEKDINDITNDITNVEIKI